MSIDQDYFIRIISLIGGLKTIDNNAVRDILAKNPLPGGQIPSKSKIIAQYNSLKDSGALKLDSGSQALFEVLIKKKPVRTLSGVTTVTVLTKPYPCPGNCIYCPNDPSMPKSYIHNEPGAQRALANNFDPYRQTYNRLLALRNNGHNVEKIELIVLGGTFTFYPIKYQIWFVKKCFDALNDFNAKSTVDNGDHKENTTWKMLYLSQKINETAYSRCVGLSVETRPDCIDPKTLINLRKLGVTKVQMGIQALSDAILKKNNRGHLVKHTELAFDYLRMAGFKIQAHWMPNLLGSSPANDIKQYKKLVSNIKYIPDEIKIYPCTLIAGTRLVKFYDNKLWKPYTQKDINKVIKTNLLDTPRFIRLSRVVRDISSTDIIAGNKITNLRQDIDKELLSEGKKLVEIRSREIHGEIVSADQLTFKKTKYSTQVSEEYFLEYINIEDKIAGFLRLSLPKKNIFTQLVNCAIIREIHVYGFSLKIGQSGLGMTQHSGLGTNLIKIAEDISRDAGYRKMAVISSVGTREYYRKNGFYDRKLYQYKLL